LKNELGQKKRGALQLHGLGKKKKAFEKLWSCNLIVKAVGKIAI